LRDPSIILLWWTIKGKGKVGPPKDDGSMTKRMYRSQHIVFFLSLSPHEGNLSRRERERKKRNYYM